MPLKKLTQIYYWSTSPLSLLPGPLSPRYYLWVKSYHLIIYYTCYHLTVCKQMNNVEQNY